MSGREEMGIRRNGWREKKEEREREKERETELTKRQGTRATREGRLKKKAMNRFRMVDVKFRMNRFWNFSEQMDRSDSVSLSQLDSRLLLFVSHSTVCCIFMTEWGFLHCRTRGVID